MNIPMKYEDVVAKLDAALETIALKHRDMVEAQTAVTGWALKYDALQQRLTVAEQRVDLLEGLLKSGSSPTYAHCSAVMEVLKPAAELEHICEGCGSKGWTANCDQCVPY